MSISRSIIIFLGALFLSSAVLADGQISGLVRSESGRALSGITVSLIAGEQRQSQSQFTDAFGRYQFPSVDRGVYQLTIEDQNFIYFIDEDPFPDEGSVYVNYTKPDSIVLQENQELNLGEVVLQQADATDTRQASASVSDCSNFGDGLNTQTLSYALENAREILIQCTGTIIVPEIILRRDVVITAAFGVTFEGEGTARVIRVLPGVIAEITGVNIAGGDVRSDKGAAIYNTGITTISHAEINGNSGNAATVFNQGILNLNQVRQFGNSILYDSVYRNSGVINGSDVTIESHTATSGPVITNTGTIELRGCSISGLATNNVFSVNNWPGSVFKLFDCTLTDSSSWFQNEGTLEIFDSSIDDNQGDQSVIESSGVLKVGGTGITNNSVYGLVIFNAGSAEILNSTISANRAGVGLARGQENDSRGVVGNEGLMTIKSSTIAGNTHLGFTDRQIGNAGELRLSNTIVVGTGNGEECGGDAAITSQGYNLHTDGSCGTAIQSDIPFGSAALLALANNGGLGKTLALQEGSDAIDAGNCNDGTLSKDQRGVARPQGNGCDIGAFELEVSDSENSSEPDNGNQNDATVPDDTETPGTDNSGGSTPSMGDSNETDGDTGAVIDPVMDTDNADDAVESSDAAVIPEDSSGDVSNPAGNSGTGGGAVGGSLFLYGLFLLLFIRRMDKEFALTV